MDSLLAKLFLPITILFLVACDSSHEESVAGIAEQFEYNSSSTESSSSNLKDSMNETQSSSNVSSSSEFAKSSSSGYDNIPYTGYCQYISASSAPRRPSENTWMSNEPSTGETLERCTLLTAEAYCTDEEVNYEHELIESRAEILVKNGESAETAQFKAQKELYALIGIDIDEKLEHTYRFWELLFNTSQSGAITKNTFTQEFIQNGTVKDFDACWHYNNRSSSCLYPSYCRDSYIVSNGYYIVGLAPVSDSNCTKETINKINDHFEIRCRNLPPCDESMNDSVMEYIWYEDDLHSKEKNHRGLHVCKEGIWSAISDSAYTLRYETCDKNNKRVKDLVNEGVFYVCHEGKWICSNFSDAKKTPMEYFFNPDLEYGSFEDPRDGHVYRTTEYNGQTWLSENLKYLPKADSFFTSQAECSFQYGCEAMGIIYTSEAAQKACPEGWRLPTKADFDHIVNLPDSTASKYAHKMFTQLSGIYEEVFYDEYGLSFVPFSMSEDPSMFYVVSFWLDELQTIISFKRMKYLKEENSFAPKFEVRKENEKRPVRCIKK